MKLQTYLNAFELATYGCGVLFAVNRLYCTNDNIKKYKRLMRQADKFKAKVENQLSSVDVAVSHNGGKTWCNTILEPGEPCSTCGEKA